MPLAPSINVTPLIDVLLVLLIIFMVITPLKPARFKAQVPPPPVPRAEPNPLALIVTIERDSHLSLNQEKSLGTIDDADALAKRLALVFEARRKNRVLDPMFADQTDLPEESKIVRAVFIRAPRAIDYGAVAKVIDSIKGAGANPIGLQIDDLEQ
jgi:biopolymer transport protein ExbD